MKKFLAAAALALFLFGSCSQDLTVEPETEIMAKKKASTIGTTGG